MLEMPAVRVSHCVRSVIAKGVFQGKITFPHLSLKDSLFHFKHEHTYNSNLKRY